MRAVVFLRPYELQAAEVAPARVEAPTDALVRVLRAGVCGSDLHVYRGHETGLDPGTVMGHEVVGEIVELGEAVHGFTVGQRVVSPFTTSCGDCRFCRRGLTCRCERGGLLGWVEEGAGLHGAQAELVRVPLAGSTLVPLPAGVSLDAALLVGDVLATGWYAADLAGVAPGSTVVVLGLGPVGLMAVLAAVERGAGRVLAVDRIDERLAWAGRLGAEPVPLDEETAERIRELTDGGAEAVLEVVGHPSATRLAVDCAAPGAVIAAVGVHNEARFAAAPGELYDKNLTYRAGRCPARAYMDDLLRAVAERDWPLDELITHRFPLERAVEAYELFDGRGDGCLKVLLEPGPAA